MSIARLIDVRAFRRLFRIDPKRDFVLATVALVGVLMFGALGGLGIAVVASLLVLVIRSYRPEVVELGSESADGTDEDDVYRSIARHPEYLRTPGVLVLRFAGQLFFANTRRLADFVTRRCAEDPTIRAVVLDAAAIPTVDTSAADELGELVTALRAAGVDRRAGQVDRTAQRLPWSACARRGWSHRWRATRRSPPRWRRWLRPRSPRQGLDRATATE